MKQREVAIIIFYDKEGKILLQDRRGISKVGEKWGYFGGKIEKGETKEEAIVREVKEELNFELKEYRYIGEVTTEDKRGRIIRQVFISKLPNLKELKQEEGENMELFTLEEAREKKKVFGDDKVIQRLEEGDWIPSNKVKGKA